jgi:DNA-nicking Smr family endonuclease
MSRRPLEPDERALWHRATSDIAARRRASQRPAVMAEELAAAEADAPRRSPPVLPAPSPSRRSPERAPDQAGGLDRRNALRLKRGQLAIEARLDLHGMIQEEAHRALTGFIGRAVGAGKRTLLIITGKGTREGSGVLRAAVPRWLGESGLRGHILAISPAIPRDGGAGALYVLLRRAR